jgi:DNA-binding MarR family transcriptional regulator
MNKLYEEISCACLHVRRADRQLSQMYDRHLRPLGIRSTQYGMLRCVDELPDPFISDIGRFLNMDQTTVTRNIEKLEKAGLVKSSPHPDDPRKKKVELSPAGKEKLAQAHPLWEEAQARILSNMGDDDFQNLLLLLNKLVHTTKV